MRRELCKPGAVVHVGVKEGLLGIRFLERRSYYGHVKDGLPRIQLGVIVAII